MRLDDPKKSFYIQYEEDNGEALTKNLTKLIQHSKKIKYSVYSWYNLIYYLLFEMKIYQFKSEFLKEKDIKKLIKKFQFLESK